MTQITTNYLRHLMSKQLNEYTPNELETECWHIMTLYEFTPDEEDRSKLKGTFDKIVAWVNPQRKGVQINPANLTLIDKRLKRELV